MRSSGKDSHGYQQQGHSGLTRTLGIRRRSFVRSLAGFACPTLLLRPPSRAQTPRVRRIGLVVGGDDVGGDAAFRETLHALGWVDGQNIVIKTPEGRFPDSLAALVRMDLELVVIGSLLSVLRARPANPSMPLVIVTTPGIISN